MFELSEQDEIITEFDERLFGVVVERVVASGMGWSLSFWEESFLFVAENVNKYSGLLNAVFC